MNYLKSPNGQSPFEAAHKPKACTQRIGASANRISHRGPLRAEVAAPHPRSRKGIVHLFFCRKKNIQDKKNPHASEGQRPKAESKPKVCERVFPQHLSKSQRLLRRLTSFQLVDFSREGAILRRRSPNRQSLFEAARKSSICTHQPKQSTRTHEKCDSSEGHRPESESKPKVCERVNSRRRASRRLACRLKWALPIWAYWRLNNLMFPHPAIPFRIGYSPTPRKSYLVPFFCSKEEPVDLKNCQDIFIIFYVTVCQYDKCCNH
ncbi:hypothetical protein SDC9_35849 [bioreactor metagenome]|uniref:Uncharacterized protein n=1 Tax=bioreactor metagenome TaxID=1076179 RepID=A0A644VF00_9ZZZZ